MAEPPQHTLGSIGLVSVRASAVQRACTVMQTVFDAVRAPQCTGDEGSIRKGRRPFLHQERGGGGAIIAVNGEGQGPVVLSNKLCTNAGLNKGSYCVPVIVADGPRVTGRVRVGGTPGHESDA